MLSGVPSNLDLVPGAEVTLDSFFGWTPDGIVAPPFLEAFERALRIDVDVTVVMDEFAFGALVDYLGGLPLVSLKSWKQKTVENPWTVSFFLGRIPAMPNRSVGKMIRLCANW